MTQCFKTIMKESGKRIKKVLYQEIDKLLPKLQFSFFSGPLGFYRGMATPLVLATPVSSLVFMGNDFAKKTFMPKNGSSF